MEAQHHPRGRIRARIGWIMAGLALVPLAGLMWFATHQIRLAVDQRTDTNAVIEATSRSVALVHLASGVADEKHWTHAVNSLEDLGVDPEVMARVVGIDVVHEQSESRREVDQWLARLDDEVFAGAIAALRADTERTTVELTAAFEPLENHIERAHQHEIDSVVGLAAGLPGGSDLVRAARVLETAAAVRSDLGWQFSSYFGARFTVERSTEEEITNLIERAGNYRSNLDRLVRLAHPESSTAVRLAVVLSNQDVQAFGARIDSEIADSIGGQLVESADDISGTIGDPAEIAATYTTALSSTRAHLDLVTAAGDDVTLEARALGSSADEALVRASATGLVITLLSVIAALAATQVIVGPLWRLSQAASMLRGGRLDVDVDERGPHELKTAARAMNEAIGQLQLVERQALALADGATDDPALHTTAPGQLGASLQRAVAHLRTSLAEREEFRRRLAHEASHDGLTSMPNRRAATSHLTQALARMSRSRETLAVLFIDLDDFKAVNDLYGHGTGDRMLVQIGQRITAAVREGDLAGRLGGDEFMVVAEPVDSEADALAAAHRIMEAVRQPLTLGDLTLMPRCSIGVALPRPGDVDAESLIHDADLAVYEAKRKGRDRAALCTEQLREQVVERGVVERGLATALEEDQLELHLQTVTAGATGEVVSLEALVRWRHPEQGLLHPDTFIPVAERTDLIIELDRWVLDRAAALLASWHDDPELGGLSLAVNVSSRHLTRPDLADQVLGTLARHGVDPCRLILEVTESALLDDLDTAADLLQQVRDQGVLVAIDDFGTGFTSLAHLRILPVDILKIDRTYVVDLGSGDGSLVHLIIDAGHLLGLRITAEGVETIEQADALRHLGADCLQGYLFSTPCPAEELDLASAVAVADGWR